ncbi:MAG: NAD(P)/FAD-dependent oxidoreductase [Gammaproteobacteria bacterium]
MSETFIVIGAGQAGLQICDSLRKEGFAGKLLLIGDEAMPPYQRPPLSKQYLEGALDSERLPFRPASFFENNEIELLLSTTVEAVNVQEHSLVLDSKETISFAKLAFATGTRVRKLPIPGGELDGVHYLRSVQDAEDIRRDLANAQSLVAIGGGFIGLEIAAVARKSGIDVTVVEAQNRLMERAVSPLISQYFADVHCDAGVTLVFDASVSKIEKNDGHFTVTMADDSTLSADLVVAGIGALPNVEVAAAAGIECDNGIVVDSLGRTSAVDVYAAGDCTMHHNAKLGIRHRLESVQNAVDQAKTVAASMVGLEKPYVQIPWFWSDQYDKKLQMVGTSIDADQSVVRGDPSDDAFSVFYFREGRLTGVDSVNRAKDHMFGRKFLNNDIHITSEQAADESVDLKTVATQ